MANWSNPLITTQYDVFVAEVKDRDADTATMFSGSSSNQPVGSVRFNRTTKIFEEWNGSAWVALVIGITGGGTGANSGAGAGTALGLGSMAYQNSNNVNITAGSIQGFTVFRPAAHLFPMVHATYDIGSTLAYMRNGFFANGLVIPAGDNLYVVG